MCLLRVTGDGVRVCLGVGRGGGGAEPWSLQHCCSFQVFIHVIVPKGYDYQRVEYHFGEEKLLLNLPLMTPAEAKAQTFADPSAITRVAPITLSPNPNPHPKLSSLAPPNGFPQAGAKGTSQCCGAGEEGTAVAACGMGMWRGGTTPWAAKGRGAGG